MTKFMGGQNVLSGAVEALRDGVATLRHDCGDRFAVPVDGSTCTEGEVVFCALRRDRIELEKAGAPEETRPNVLRGGVHAIECQGSYVKITLDVEGVDEFVALVGDERLFDRPVDLGDRMLARWRSKDMRMLADTAKSAAAAIAAQPYGAGLGLAGT